MTQEKNIGNEPAFPAYRQGRQGFADIPTIESKYFTGITLRDYFAIHSPPPDMAWLKAKFQEEADEHSGILIKQTSVDSVRYRVKWAYEYADAMLKARGS